MLKVFQKTKNRKERANNKEGRRSMRSKRKNNQQVQLSKLHLKENMKLMMMKKMRTGTRKNQPRRS